jgi:hypothetical protein
MPCDLTCTLVPTLAARMVAIGYGDIAFARSFPSLFLLMFRGERLDLSRHALRAAVDARGLSGAESVKGQYQTSHCNKRCESEGLADEPVLQLSSASRALEQTCRYDATRGFFFRFAASVLSLRNGRERGQTSARKCTSVPVSASSFRP